MYSSAEAGTAQRDMWRSHQERYVEGDVVERPMGQELAELAASLGAQEEAEEAAAEADAEEAEEEADAERSESDYAVDGRGATRTTSTATVSGIGLPRSSRAKRGKECCSNDSVPSA
jgi:hypothetical protein